MTDETSRFGPPIDLAGEADFNLGDLQVSPSTRGVIRGGERETLEPRVMQVLVALAQAGGRVVSRDELIVRCWDGRIVGEDAINRAIGRLRHLSEVDYKESFVIETIPRVGYRLLLAIAPLPPTSIENAVPAPSVPKTAAPRLAPQSVVMRNRLIIAATVAVIVGAATTWLLRPTFHPSTSQYSVVIPPVLPTPTGVSLAVLPFLNLSPDKDQEFFSDGMTEEVTSALAKVPGLTVIGRTSAFQFKGANRDMRAIGRALGAKNLIEGSVRKDGDEVRITAHLVRVADGADLWTESYDRKLTGIFAVQEDIATAIARALQVPLGLKQGQNLVSNRTDDPDAYQQYLQARALYRARQIDEAISKLNLVVARDPRYAPAWALLAAAYALPDQIVPVIIRAGDGIIKTEEARQFVKTQQNRAENAAQEAIHLDPKLAMGYEALAMLEANKGNWVASSENRSKALALDPNDPDILYDYAYLLAAVGDLQAAHRVEIQILAQEPFVPNYKRQAADVLWAMGQNDAAMEMLKGVDGAGRALVLAKLYASKGKNEEAADAILLITPSEYFPRQSLDDAARLIRSGAGNNGSRDVLPQLVEGLNFVYLFAGTKDRYLEAAERTTDIGFTSGILREVWAPVSASLRKTERFKSYMRKAGLVDYWRARGWPDLCHPVGADDFACN
jgi:TolB-like protein/DNA-binding winged helix-turn-helix (wHTH) protein